MAEDWFATQQDVTADLVNEGTSFTFRRRADLNYDPIEGAYNDSTEQSFVLHGIFTSYGLNPPASVIWQPETTVENGDTVLLLDCSELIRIGDIVEIDGDDWLVKSPSVLRPGGTPLLQYVLIKRA